mgnify:CR=1 FL=1
MRFPIGASGALLLGALLVAPSLATAQDPFGAWAPADPDAALRRRDAGPEWVRPDAFQAVQLDLPMMEALLASAPPETEAQARTAPAFITVPMPDGSFETFELVETEMMEFPLRAWMDAQGWPMRTYKGRGVEDPDADIRVDFGGPGGFHASIFRGVERERVHVDRLWRDDTTLYASYRASDLRRDEAWECHYALANDLPSESMEELFPEKEANGDRSRNTSGNLRRYRAAVAATGEYTAFHGGTVPAGLAAIVTSMNRVNQVYERDLSVRMVLVANNNLIVYTNGASDPYTNNDGVAMLGQNQSNLDSVIGSANYDVGHVFSTGGGGVASLGSICSSGSKARGVTGQGSPVGDPFDIDFVAHEMGHQYGGNHTFNGSNGSCGGNRAGNAAYEPGSGITIQAYAGICGADNLASNSIPYFHAKSLEEMFAEVLSGPCFQTTSNVNPSAPVAQAGPARTIPANTPIWLEATGGFDADGDSLTYSWEQYDLGPQRPLSAGDGGSGPITRSFPPTPSPVRTIPRLERLSTGTSDAGDILPTTNRPMTFRLTVRDNNPAGGRTGFSTLNLTTTTSAGPFQATAPANNTLERGVTTARWNVNGTNLAPVSAELVDILLSTDGGLTFPTLLLAATPNDGEEVVTLPQATSNTARIMVRATDHNFFAITPTNFRLQPFDGPIVRRATPLVLQDSTGNGNDNGFPEPGELDLRLPLALANLGTQAGTGTTAELVSLTPGVTVLTGVLSFGSVPALQTVESPQPFVLSIAEDFPCGAPFTLRLDITSGGVTIPEEFTNVTGEPGGPVTTVLGTFDASTTLPAEWAVEVLAGPDNWRPRANSNAASSPNVVSFEPGSSTTGDARLISPEFIGGGQLSFRHTFAFENTYDGAILEASIAGGPWQQILDIPVGGYNGTLRAGTANALAGRAAWTGGSLGNLTEVRANLDAFTGQPMRVAFRIASDVSVSSVGWRIDNVTADGFQAPTCEPALLLNAPSTWLFLAD